MFIRPYHCLPSLAASIRVTGNTDVFVAPHIKNISPNYPRDVLQMFDKRNMTITRGGRGLAALEAPTGPPGLSAMFGDHSPTTAWPTRPPPPALASPNDHCGGLARLS